MQFRHGDVMIEKVKKLPKEKRSLSSHECLSNPESQCVFASGEREPDGFDGPQGCQVSDGDGENQHGG